MVGQWNVDELDDRRRRERNVSVFNLKESKSGSTIGQKEKESGIVMLLVNAACYIDRIKFNEFKLMNYTKDTLWTERETNLTILF